MAPPLVSFLIPTCGRMARQPNLLNEAVWWCANQTYQNIEVLVLNDAPGHELVCNYPKVRVINMPERYPDLGTKMNMMCRLALGEICLVNEDDDISCSYRALQAVSYLRYPGMKRDDGGYEGFDWWSPRLWVFAQNGRPPVIDGNGTGYSSSAFRRTAMMGNHPPAIVAHDREAVSWARANLKCNPKDILDKPVTTSMIYRWGVSDFHFSGSNDPVRAWHEYNPGPAGLYRIEPHSSTNWDDVVKVAASSYKA